MTDERPITQWSDREVSRAYIDTLMEILATWDNADPDGEMTRDLYDKLLTLENKASIYSMEIRLRKVEQARRDRKW